MSLEMSDPYDNQVLNGKPITLEDILNLDPGLEESLYLNPAFFQASSDPGTCVSDARNNLEFGME